MGRSSRILGFLVILIAVPGAAHGRSPMGVPMRAAPVIAAPRLHAAVAPDARHARSLGALHGGRRRRLDGRRFGFGDGLGFGLPDTPAPPYPGDDPTPGAMREEGVPAVPPPCVPPLIIEIGRGVRHLAKTRVIYGAPPCGAPFS